MIHGLFRVIEKIRYENGIFNPQSVVKYVDKVSTLSLFGPLSIISPLSLNLRLGRMRFQVREAVRGDEGSLSVSIVDSIGFYCPSYEFD